MNKRYQAEAVLGKKYERKTKKITTITKQKQRKIKALIERAQELESSESTCCYLEDPGSVPNTEMAAQGWLKLVPGDSCPLTPSQPPPAPGTHVVVCVDHLHNVSKHS